MKWSEVAQSCLTLCGPMDCSLPGISVHGIFQARILEWVATSVSRGSSQPRDQTWVDCIGRQILYLLYLIKLLSVIRKFSKIHIASKLKLQLFSICIDTKEGKMGHINCECDWRCCSVAKLCLTLCILVDCSLPSSSVHGILQTRVLEWVAIAFSSRSRSCY